MKNSGQFTPIVLPGKKTAHGIALFKRGKTVCGKSTNGATVALVKMNCSDCALAIARGDV